MKNAICSNLRELKAFQHLVRLLPPQNSFIKWVVSCVVRITNKFQVRNCLIWDILPQLTLCKIYSLSIQTKIWNVLLKFWKHLITIHFFLDCIPVQNGVSKLYIQFINDILKYKYKRELWQDHNIIYVWKKNETRKQERKT